MTSRLAVVALVLVGALCSYAPAAQAAAPKHPTVVSITFDDGFASQMRAAPILRHYGVHATFYVNSELLNAANRLTFAQIRALAAAGNEIGGHTSDHTSLISVDAAEGTRQVCNDRVALSRIIGRAPRSFAYPYGASNRATERLVEHCGYSSARIVGGLTCPRCARAESLTPARRFHVKTSYSFVESTRIADAKRAIRQVAAARRRMGATRLPRGVQSLLGDGCSPERTALPAGLDLGAPVSAASSCAPWAQSSADRRCPSCARRFTSAPTRRWRMPGWLSPERQSVMARTWGATEWTRRKPLAAGGAPATA